MWKTGIAEEELVGKGLQDILELLGGSLFYGEDACQPYAKGTICGVGVHVEDRRSGGGWLPTSPEKREVRCSAANKICAPEAI